MLESCPKVEELIKPNRKPISKALRFEVFKRDCFKCQYCGAAAPDVLLHIDHIRAVVDGGTNHITNLITSCEPCNLGKGARPLSENTAVEKSRKQLEQLQERREQLELMMEWQTSLIKLQDEIVDELSNFWTDYMGDGIRLSKSGIQVLLKLIRKYDTAEILPAMRLAAETYFKFDTQGKLDQRSADLGLRKIGGICEMERKYKEKPHLREIYWYRNILAKRHRECPKPLALQILDLSYQIGVPLETLKNLVLTSTSYDNFERAISKIITNLAGLTT